MKPPRTVVVVVDEVALSSLAFIFLRCNRAASFDLWAIKGVVAAFELLTITFSATCRRLSAIVVAASNTVVLTTAAEVLSAEADAS